MEGFVGYLCMGGEWAFERVGCFCFCRPGMAGPGAAVGRGVCGPGSGFRVGVVRYGGVFYCYFLFVLLGWALTFLIFPNFLRFYVLRHSAACGVIRIYHVYK